MTLTNLPFLITTNIQHEHVIKCVNNSITYIINNTSYVWLGPSFIINMRNITSCSAGIWDQLYDLSYYGLVLKRAIIIHCFCILTVQGGVGQRGPPGEPGTKEQKGSKGVFVVKGERGDQGMKGGKVRIHVKICLRFA